MGGGGGPLSPTRRESGAPSNLHSPARHSYEVGPVLVCAGVEACLSGGRRGERGGIIGACMRGHVRMRVPVCT